MAHNIDMSNGRANMAFAGATPWHSLGQQLTEEQAKSFAAVLEAAGLNFEVGLRPVYVQKAGEFTLVEGFKAPFRKDSQVDFGVVGSKYRPIQNEKGLGLNGALQTLLEAGLVTIETAGSLGKGEDVWMLVKFNVDSPLVNQVLGDAVKPYGLIVNNHNGRKVATVSVTAVRVVCQNTLQMAANRHVIKALKETGEAMRVRHTSSGEENLVNGAKKVWSNVFDQVELFAKEAAILQAVNLTEAELGRLVLDLIAPVKDKQETARQQTSAAKQISRREDVRRLWDEGIGHTGDHSAWEALQAVTQSMDHNRDLWGRGDAESVLRSQMTGQIHTWKTNVMDSLLAHCIETTAGESVLDRITRVTAESSVLDRILAVN